VPDRRFAVLISLLVSVALAAGIGAYRMVGRVVSVAPPETRDVVVASTDLTEGSVLERTQLQLTPLPVAMVPRDAVLDIDSLVGRITRATIFRGEAIVQGRLAPPGSSAGIEVKIAAGKRAMAVRIDEVAGLSGLIQPNSHVDVLVTLAGSGNSAPVAKLFMSNMRVLSIGAQVERGADGAVMNATTATLEVTPQEAEQLALASNQGKIQLVLRGYGDPETVDTEGATLRTLTRNSESVEAASVRSTPPVPAARRVVPAPRVMPPIDTPSTPPASPRADTLVVRVYQRDRSDATSVVRRSPPDSLSTP